MNGQGEPATRRRRGLRALGWIALFVAALAALAGAAPLLVDTTAMRERVAREASMALGQKVRLDGELRVTLLPRPALIATDVHVLDPAPDGSPDLLAARRGVVEPSTGALLRGRLSLGRITMDGAQVWLRRDGAGRFNWQGAMGGRLPDHLFAQDLVVHYADPGRQATLVVDGFSGSTDADGRLDAEVRGRLESEDADQIPAALRHALGMQGQHTNWWASD